MTEIQEFCNCALAQKFQEAWPVPDAHPRTGIVAVSGGPDSVALARFVRQAEFLRGHNWIVAHFHHGLRPEAEKEAAFVSEFAGDLGWPVCVGRGNASPGEVSSQESSRKARYRFFLETARVHAASWILTGHTADDQAETILHNVVRGTGMRGLAGIAPRRQFAPGIQLVRPILSLRRYELVQYLQRIGQTYVSDLSNEDPKYTRSRIRHHLIPLIEREFNRDVVSALDRLGRIAREVQEELAVWGDRWYSSCVVETSAGRVELKISECKDIPSICLKEVLSRAWREAGFGEQNMTYANWKRLLSSAIGCGSAAYVLPGAVNVCRNADILVLSTRMQER